MAKPFMNCNFKNCGAALTKFAWVTRCSHVFCDEHGEMFFRKGGSQVRCPACNEVKNKETDVIRNDLNPSDLLISTVPPGKALEFAIHASRLWTHQMEYRRKCHNDQVARKYETQIIEATVQLQAENKELKNYIQAIERKLKHTNDELFKLRARLNRYKSAYHSTRSFSQMNSNNISYEQRAREDRLHQSESAESHLTSPKEVEEFIDPCIPKKPRKKDLCLVPIYESVVGSMANSQLVTIHYAILNFV